MTPRFLDAMLTAVTLSVVIGAVIGLLMLAFGGCRLYDGGKLQGHRTDPAPTIVIGSTDAGERDE